MDKIDTLFKNPCFGKASIGRNVKKHLELTPDVLLQNLSTQFGGIHNSPVDSKAASSDEELLDADNVFMRHPRYFTEERESSLIPITGAACMSLSIKEKFTTEKRPIHVSEEAVYVKSTARPANKHGNKASVGVVESPTSGSHVVNTRVTDDSSDDKVAESTADTDIMDTKLNCTLLKISSLLQEISTVIYNGIQPIESDGDNSRRQRRVTEFFSRFTRNYLYQLVRQLSDARKLLGRPTTSCRSTQTGSATHLLVQDKLATVSHTVVQALQAYSHHVPLTVTAGAHTKCLSLVAYVRELCKLLRKHLGGGAYGLVHTVEQHTHTLADAISTCLLVAAEEAGGRGTRVSLATVSNKSTATRATVPFHKRQSLDKRLAMYQTSGWKRSATVLAKERFNVQSRYKLGTYKPPMHCEARTCLTTGPAQLGSASGSKKSLGERRAARRSPVTSRVDVDNIPTMVEMELQRERQRKQLLAQRTPKHGTHVHASTSSEDDRVEEESPAAPPPAAEKPVHGARKKQEDNFKTMLQYLLVQLQQQEHQQPSKEISSAAPAAAEAEVGATERSVMRADNTATASGSVFDKIKGLVAHVRGITDAPASALHSSDLDDKGARNTTRTHVLQAPADNVQQSKTRIVTLGAAPNAKLICIKDKSCFETDRREVDGVERCASDSNETTRDPSSNVNDQLPTGTNNVVTELAENGETVPDVEEKIKELNWREPKQIPDAIVDGIIEAVYGEMQVDDVVQQLFTSEFI